MVGSILILAAHPDDEVLGCGGTMTKLSANGASVHVAFLSDGVYSRQGDKNAQQNELREQGIGTQVLYIPVHLQPWYRNTYGYGVGKCPQAETAYAGLLSLPLFPAMTEADVFKVVKSVTSL